MKSLLFTEKMKLADLALSNYRLLYLFPCFGTGLPFGERTVEQECRRRGISTELFLLACNVYTFDDYTPEAREMEAIPLDELMELLRNSHREYLEKRMPGIIDRILRLVENGPLRGGVVLSEFCEKYRREVVAHFDYEEQTVFPYITGLLQGRRPEGYKIRDYESNHGDLDAALSDLKNIMLKYLPAEYTIEMCREALIELSLFECDLAKHTLLEDRILVWLVGRIENEGR